jgi:hypothetical protein
MRKKGIAGRKNKQSQNDQYPNWGGQDSQQQSQEEVSKSSQQRLSHNP